MSNKLSQLRATRTYADHRSEIARQIKTQQQHRNRNLTVFTEERLEVGPGDYNSPDTIGNKSLISHINNSPSFSFNRAGVLACSHPQSTKNCTQPGIGDYSPDKLKVLKCSARVPMSTARRFALVSSYNIYKTNLPVSYEKNNKKSIMGGIITRAKRFFKLREILPGPADYSHAQPSRKRSLESVKSSFGSSHIGLVLKEHSLVPGPGSYIRDFDLLGHTLKLSMPKAKRMQSDTPIYQADFTKTDVDIEKYLSRTCYKYSFSHTKRLLNIKRFTALNENIIRNIKKGLPA